MQLSSQTFYVNKHALLELQLLFRFLQDKKVPSVALFCHLQWSWTIWSVIFWFCYYWNEKKRKSWIHDSHFHFLKNEIIYFGQEFNHLTYLYGRGIFINCTFKSHLHFFSPPSSFLWSTCTLENLERVCRWKVNTLAFKTFSFPLPLRRNGMLLKMYKTLTI